MVCSSNSGSEITSWTFTPPGSNNEIPICSRTLQDVNNQTTFRSGRLRDGFFNIYTTSAQLEDAGIYSCVIDVKVNGAIKVEKRSAQLVVLDSHPNCEAEDEGDRRRFRCSVGYRGNWAPVMELKRPNGSLITADDVENHVTNVTYVFILPMPQHNGGDDQSFTCRIFFKEYTGNFYATASNIPNYTYEWPHTETGTSSSESDGQNTGTTTATHSSNYTHPHENAGTYPWLTVAIGIVMSTLFVISICISYHKCRKDRVVNGEIQPVNREEIEMENDRRPEPVLYANLNGHTAEAGSCGPDNGASRNFGSSSSSPVCESLASGRERRNRPIGRKIPDSNFGADGTEYVDLNAVSPENLPTIHRHHPSRYEPSIYAAIDHTVQPPAPQQQQQRRLSYSMQGEYVVLREDA